MPKMLSALERNNDKNNLSLTCYSFWTFDVNFYSFFTQTLDPRFYYP